MTYCMLATEDIWKCSGTLATWGLNTEPHTGCMMGAESSHSQAVFIAHVYVFFLPAATWQPFHPKLPEQSEITCFSLEVYIQHKKLPKKKRSSLIPPEWYYWIDMTAQYIRMALREGWSRAKACLPLHPQGSLTDSSSPPLLQQLSLCPPNKKQEISHLHKILGTAKLSALWRIKRGDLSHFISDAEVYIIVLVLMDSHANSYQLW